MTSVKMIDQMEGVDDEVYEFVRESNRIEGIYRLPTKTEVSAHVTFIYLSSVCQIDLERFVAKIAPGKRIRDQAGMNVRVGSHLPPIGGEGIPVKLRAILHDANNGDDPYGVHRAYETLHPFMDGNGRSGRVLWLWMMLRSVHDPYVLQRGFLHTWYYQSLSATRS